MEALAMRLDEGDNGGEALVVTADKDWMVGGGKVGEGMVLAITSSHRRRRVSREDTESLAMLLLLIVVVLSSCVVAATLLLLSTMRSMEGLFRGVLFSFAESLKD